MNRLHENRLGTLDKPRGNKFKAKLYVYFKMTSKDNNSVAVTNNMKLHRDRIHQEPTRKGLQEHEAEKGVGASEGTYKDSKAPECDCRHRFLLHVLWAMLATLVVSFAIGQLELASIRQPYPSSSPLKEDLGTPTMSTSLSQDTDSSSSLPSSHATPVTAAALTNCTMSPQNQSITIIISGTCLCLLGRSPEKLESLIESAV